MKKALIIVDMQNDFCQDGALAVRGANVITPRINELMEKGGYSHIVATQDSHPEDHKSFAINHNLPVGSVITLNDRKQVLWPKHCVTGSFGEQLVSDLNLSKVDRIFKKGLNLEADSYSGFMDDDGRSTGLHEYLSKRNVKSVTVVGLALDYCVKATALDAKNLGYQVEVLLSMTRAVNINETDSAHAAWELKCAGVIVRMAKIDEQASRSN